MVMPNWSHSWGLNQGKHFPVRTENDELKITYFNLKLGKSSKHFKKWAAHFLSKLLANTFQGIGEGCTLYDVPYKEAPLEKGYLYQASGL